MKKYFKLLYILTIISFVGCGNEKSTAENNLTVPIDNHISHIENNSEDNLSSPNENNTEDNNYSLPVEDNMSSPTENNIEDNTDNNYSLPIEDNLTLLAENNTKDNPSSPIEDNPTVSSKAVPKVYFADTLTSEDSVVQPYYDWYLSSNKEQSTLNELYSNSGRLNKIIKLNSIASDNQFWIYTEENR